MKPLNISYKAQGYRKTISKTNSPEENVPSFFQSNLMIFISNHQQREIFRKRGWLPID
jgi:hypothetical protein